MRNFKIEVVGHIRADTKPHVQVHDWVQAAPFSWDAVNVDVTHQEKSPSAKGGQFEREFLKKLSRWVSDGKDSDVYWRTAGSGAFATRKQINVQLGDVTVFPEKVDIGGWLMDIAVFELRNRDLSLGSLFKTPFTWLSDLVTKCINSKVNKIPFVIMKSDGALCTFTIADVAHQLDLDCFEYKNSLIMFDFRQVLKLNVGDVRKVWEEIRLCPS